MARWVTSNALHRRRHPFRREREMKRGRLAVPYALAQSGAAGRETATRDPVQRAYRRVANGLSVMDQRIASAVRNAAAARDSKRQVPRPLSGTGGDYRGSSLRPASSESKLRTVLNTMK